ncbi:MAG: hypothetical protein R3Y11_12375, partial [Pseudomonadota bacterium]
RPPPLLNFLFVDDIRLFVWLFSATWRAFFVFGGNMGIVGLGKGIRQDEKDDAWFGGFDCPACYIEESPCKVDY